MKSTNGNNGFIGMKRRKLRSTPIDPLETITSTKVKPEILDETSSSSSFGKEIVYAEVIQSGAESIAKILPPDSDSAPSAAATKLCESSEPLSLESSKDSTNSKQPSEKDTTLEVLQSVDSSKSHSSTSEDCKQFVKSDLLSPPLIKHDPKFEPILPSELTQDIIPNDFIRFSDEMQTRIMARHPKAKPEDAEELLNLLKSEYHDIKFKDHSYLKMKPMPYRLKLMRNVKNCFVKLEVFRGKKEFNFDFKREVASEFSGFHDQGYPFDPMTPMAPMTSLMRSSRGGRVLKMRYRADDMLYYQPEHTSPSKGLPVPPGMNTPRGRAGKKRTKTNGTLIKQLSTPNDSFNPCPLPVQFAQIPQQKPKRAYNKKIKISSEKGIDDRSVINNLVAASQHPPSLVSSLESPPANNNKETELPTDHQSPQQTDYGCDYEVSSVDKQLPTVNSCMSDKQPNSTKEGSQEKSKRTYKKKNKAADVIDLAYKALIKEEDECDVIGNLVTMKLRNILKINPTMKILAEKLINETIFEAEMGTLSPYHSIMIDHAQSYSPGIDHNASPYPCNFDQSVQTFPFSVNHAPPPPHHSSPLPHHSSLPHLSSSLPHLSSPLPHHSSPLPHHSSPLPHHSSLLPHHSLPLPPSTSASQNPPGVSFNFNQNLSYYSPPTNDHQPRHIVRSTDRPPNSFMSL